MNCVFGFYYHWKHLVRIEQGNWCSVSCSSDPSRSFSPLRIIKEYLIGKDTWVCSKALQHGLSFCPSWPMIKKMLLFHYVWEILNVFMCYMPDKKLKHSYVTDYGLDRIAEIIVNHSLDFSYKLRISFLIRTIRVRLLSCHTFIIPTGLIQFFSSPLQCPQLDIQTLWILCIGLCGVNSMQYSMLFLNFWRSELYQGEAFLNFPPTDSSLLHSRQNLKMHMWDW